MSEDNNSLLQDLLDQHDYDMPQEGDIRTGTIVAITPQGVIVDLGLKRDGIVPVSDLNKLEPEEREGLQVNDELPVYVLETADPEALIVSIHMARLNQDWIEAEALLESGEMFEGEVIGYNKGGVIVPYGRIRGFVPISHLTEIPSGMSERRRQQRLAKLRGETLGLKVIEVDRRRHRLVLSQREAYREWEELKRAELMEVLNEGETRVGRVSGIRDFGAFVDLGGADGLVHISELSWHRIDHPREVVKIGDEIEVYVLGIDQESGRISLSRKKLLANPWDTVTERYDTNDLVEGRITRILDYGAFAEIEPGIEGLLHVSQLSRSPVEDPRTVVSEGETHLLRVVSVDQKRQRIGLSLKAVTANEQIEWMAQREIEEAQRIEEEEAAASAAAFMKEAEEDLDVADAADEVAATASEVAEVAKEVAEEQLAEGDTATAAVAEEVAEAAEEVAEAATEIVEEATAAAEEAVAETVETLEEATAEAEATVTEAVEAVEETVDEIAAEVVEETEAVVEAVTEEAEAAVEGAQDAAADVSETVEDAAEVVAEEAEDVVAEVVETVEDATEAVSGEEPVEADKAG
jgi:small subunit ribosomal protein S1